MAQIDLDRLDVGPLTNATSDLVNRLGEYQELGTALDFEPRISLISKLTFATFAALTLEQKLQALLRPSDGENPLGIRVIAGADQRFSAVQIIGEVLAEIRGGDHEIGIKAAGKWLWSPDRDSKLPDFAPYLKRLDLPLKQLQQVDVFANASARPGTLGAQMETHIQAVESTAREDSTEVAAPTMSELANGTMWELSIAWKTAPHSLDHFHEWSDIRHHACELFQHSNFDGKTWTRLLDWLAAEHGRRRKDDSLWKTSRKEVVELLRAALAKGRANDQGMATHPLADLAWEFHELARPATANYYLRASVQAYLDRRRAEASKPVQSGDIHAGVRPPALPYPDEWNDRQLARDEKMAILAALHDVVCFGVDKIGPWAEEELALNQIPVHDQPAAIAWAVMVRYARELREAHRPQMKAILGDVRAELEIARFENQRDSTQRQPRVFFSYSHKDKKWLELIQTGLKPVVQADLLWDDTKMKAGDRWREEIEKAIASATAAVLLVSPSFLASDFIAKNELPPLLEAAQKKGLTILWVHVSHSMYKHTPIEAYQATHDAGQPLADLRKNKRDQVIVKICEQIKAAAEKPISA